MSQTVSVIVSAEDRARLAAIVGDRSRPLKHVQRAKIVLHSADRLATAEVARRSEVSRPAVWRWQRHYAEGGVERLLREGSRKPGKPPVPLSRVAAVVALTCSEPPGEVTHWTGRAMAKAAKLSLTTVQRIWKAHHLQPHRLRTFKRSKDPAFAAKVEDIVGLYMHPPAHAVVLSIDEKSQIQALDRTQPGLPLKPGKCGTMTHDYKRHGTTTLFAAFNVLDGAVLGRCMQKHTHQEFIRFLNAVEREVRAGKIIHAVLDNYATHKHPKVREWLARHPRWVFHFTPTSGSWLNAVENFFSALTRRRIRRGAFKSIADLQAAINRYLDEHNANPKPFVWTKPADAILVKLQRLPVPSV
jgi:DDE superfamily endonuclease/homeodomain-containing protein